MKAFITAILLTLSFLLTFTLFAREETPQKDSKGEYNGEGELTIQESNNQFIVTSNASPSWKVIIATGSGTPGGGTPIKLFIPSNSTESIVQSTPGSSDSYFTSLGLGNLEWRHTLTSKNGEMRGKHNGLGTSSVVTHFEIIENTKKSVKINLTGKFDNVNRFSNQIWFSPNGFLTTISLDYRGATGLDSSWLLGMTLNPNLVNAEKSETLMTSRVKNAKTDTAMHNYNFPLKKPAKSNITLVVLSFGTEPPSYYDYELFEAGQNIGKNPGYDFYPRWNGPLKNTTYKFEWRWIFQ